MESLMNTASKPAIQDSSSLGVVLIGGGTDVDDAFRWMIERSSGAPVVTVLRAAGSDAYNSYIYGLGNCTAVCVNYVVV